MFAIRVHSVDTDHLLFHTPSSSVSTSTSTSTSKLSNPNPNTNPKITERRGVVHLFRALSRHPSSCCTPITLPRATLLLIVAVPNYFSSDDLLRFFGSQVVHISEFLIIRNDGMEDRYTVLIKMVNQVSADAFYCSFNGRRFSPPEVEICHIIFVLSVEFTELAEIASTPPAGYTQLPICPICLERLDQDTSGIQSTLCDHSFQCSCVSKWTYLSCQVCRLCQQQEENLTCSVCATSDNLWICVICGFIGCGRYKEGHMFGHWKDTQHCFSLDLETRRVWDYDGDVYVHRLNQSKVDSKSVTMSSMSLDECGTCGGEDDSEITMALYDSKVEAIMDEYNHLLATQLENQRKHYESLLVEVRSKKEKTIAEAVERAVTIKSQELQSELGKYLEENKAVADMNQKLMKKQEDYKRRIKEAEEREVLSLRSRDEQMQDLEEQIRDVKIYVQAQRTLSGMADSDSVKGGTVLPMPVKQSSPSKTKRQAKPGRRRK